MLTHSPAARTALVYVTIGSLVLVWTAVWSSWTVNYPPEGRGLYYILGGLFASGLTLLVIGLGVGRLGSSARHADNPAIVVAPGAMPSAGAVVAPATPETVVAPAPAVAPPPEAPRVVAPSPPTTTEADNRYQRPHATPVTAPH